MDKNKRKTIEGLIDKASNQQDAAKRHIESVGQYSEAIQAAQQCVELSVKSILSLLGIEYPPSHEWVPWKKEFSAIAEQIQKRRILETLVEQHLQHTIPLPRLLFLVNFWGKSYITAKYGFEAEYLAPAQDLFKREEADLAIRHADECLLAARTLRYLDGEKLAALASTRAG